jgi:pyruvate/2-oxoglutarate/acetoin dehydrogenase E1 component
MVLCQYVWHCCVHVYMKAQFRGIASLTIVLICVLLCSLLQAPVQRVCGYDTPFPLVFEKCYVPDALKVYEAIKKAVHY